MTALTNITRRTFVATAAAAGGGIVFGLPFPKAGSRVDLSVSYTHLTLPPIYSV